MALLLMYALVGVAFSLAVLNRWRRRDEIPEAWDHRMGALMLLVLVVILWPCVAVSWIEESR